MATKANSPKTTILRFICDKRWSNNESTDELQIIFEGPTFVDADMVETAIVFHRSFNCFELIIFEAPNNSVWARFYFPRENLKSKLSREDYDRIVEEKKDFFRKRHRHFDLDTLKCGANCELLKRVILGLVPDLLSYDLSHRLQDDSNPFVKDIFKRPAVFNGYDLQSLTFIAPKHDFLVPANVVPAETESSFKMYTLAQRQHQHCQRGVKAFQSILSCRYKVRSLAMNSSASPINNKTVTVSGKYRASRFFANIRASLLASSSTSPHPSAAPRNILTLYAPEQISPNHTTNHSGKFSPVTPSSTTSMAQRIGSFFQRRLSTMITSGNSFMLNKASQPHTNSNPQTPMPVKEISLARFRWYKAVHKVLTKQWTIYFRQRLHHQALLIQLKRVILRRRSDYGMLMQQRLSNENDVSSSSLPTSPTTNTRSRNSPAPIYRNLSTMVDLHQQSVSNMNLNAGSFNNKPNSFASALNHQNEKKLSSFRQTLSQVRTKIVAAGAFARFEHLKINTKVGTDPTSSTSSHLNATASSPLKVKPSPSSSHLTASTSSQSLPSSGASVTSLTTASVNSASTHRINANSSTRSNSNNTVNNNSYRKPINPPLTASTPTSHHRHHYNPNNSTTNSSTVNNSSLHMDSPLMKHASKRVAVTN